MCLQMFCTHWALELVTVCGSCGSSYQPAGLCTSRRYAIDGQWIWQCDPFSIPNPLYLDC